MIRWTKATVTPVKKGLEADVPKTDSSASWSGSLPRGWTDQYTSDFDVFGKFGKGICETGVALHPRLQDRASFGDYCRGATAG